MNAADRRLISREGARLVDVLAGRADARTRTCHYLILERPSLVGFGPDSEREIEQYRDLERVVSEATDLETGARRGAWVGAFTATYRDGKLSSIAMVEDMGERVAAERALPSGERLTALASRRGMLKAAE